MRVFLTGGLLLLGFSTVLLILGHPGRALQASQYAFWFLVGGLITYLSGLKNEK